MQPAKPLLRAAIAKAVQDLRERPHRLDACMGAMQMTTLSKAQLWARIKALEKR